MEINLSIHRSMAEKRGNECAVYLLSFMLINENFKFSKKDTVRPKRGPWFCMFLFAMLCLKELWLLRIRLFQTRTTRLIAVDRYFLFVTRHFLLVARYFLLVARYFLLVAHYFLLVASLLFARYSLRFVRCSSVFARCFVIFCSLLITFCFLLCYFLLVAHFFFVHLMLWMCNVNWEREREHDRKCLN